MSWLTYILIQKNENVLPLLTNSLQKPPQKKNLPLINLKAIPIFHQKMH